MFATTWGSRILVNSTHFEGIVPGGPSSSLSDDDKSSVEAQPRKAKADSGRKTQP